MSYFLIDTNNVINEEKNMQQMTHEKQMKKALTLYLTHQRQERRLPTLRGNAIE